MAQDLLEERDGRVVTLTLNRPERLNAFTPDMPARLSDALLRCDSDDSVGAVVLTGAGRAFCAGGDVKRMVSVGAAPTADTAATLRAKMNAAQLLHCMSKPTLAVINGAAAGAGLSLALACDFRIAGASAIFTTAFAKIGLPGDFGGSFFMSRLLGSAKARELYFLSPLLDATQALALGLVNRVTPDEELQAAGAQFARELASGPTAAYGYMKRNLNAAESGTLAELLDMEALHQIAAGSTEDHRQAARAFAEKRTPVFTGR